jgi:hypothetical protein
MKIRNASQAAKSQESPLLVGVIGSGVERLKRKTEELQRERSWVKKIQEKREGRKGKKKTTEDAPIGQARSGRTK